MTDIARLTHQLARTVHIQATRETVFGFFTDPTRWAAWWGAGSTIDSRPGGRILIRYPDGTEALGEVLEITPPERISFTYGYAKGTPIPPSTSLVTISLEDAGGSTRLRLTHAFADASVRDQHIQGWRYQLSLFTNVVANEVHADAAAIVDRWFAAWSQPDGALRDAELANLVSDGVRLRDPFSAIEGLADLREHMAAARRFMPGVRMVRNGGVSQCQGMAIADWIARTAEGEMRGAGTNVFELAGDGRVRTVTGFWRESAIPRCNEDTQP